MSGFLYEKKQQGGQLPAYNLQTCFTRAPQTLKVFLTAQKNDFERR